MARAKSQVGVAPGLIDDSKLRRSHTLVCSHVCGCFCSFTAATEITQSPKPKIFMGNCQPCTRVQLLVAGTLPLAHSCVPSTYSSARHIAGAQVIPGEWTGEHVHVELRVW